MAITCSGMTSPSAPNKRTRILSLSIRAAALALRKLPHRVRLRSGDFDPFADTVKIMTMHASKGLEFPVVAVAGVGQMPRDGEEPADEARLFYVAATRATQKLVLTVAGTSAFAQSLIAAPHLFFRAAP